MVTYTLQLNLFVNLGKNAEMFLLSLCARNHRESSTSSESYMLPDLARNKLKNNLTINWNPNALCWN